jgi:hypothetical protein
VDSLILKNIGVEQSHTPHYPIVLYIDNERTAVSRFQYDILLLSKGLPNLTGLYEADMSAHQIRRAILAHVRFTT